MNWGTELLLILQRGKPFGNAYLLWWIWAATLLCSIRAAAVIGAGEVRTVSEQARGAWILGKKLELSGMGDEDL